MSKRVTRKRRNAAGLLPPLAVIATPGNATAALAAKATTAIIPIVFSVADDPVNLGLVANLARPGGNATGSIFFAVEVTAKRLGLLYELVPKAVRIAVLVNPANATNTQATLRDLSEAAGALGMQIQVLRAFPEKAESGIPMRARI
jgi:putative ABC transport system substrate-binding protein